MTLHEARKIIEEIHERYGVQFSETHEKRENGRVKMVLVTLKFLVETERPKKVLDKTTLF